MSQSWMTEPTGVDGTTAVTVIAAITFAVLAVVALFALTSREAPEPTFTCAPGQTYTVEVCP